MSLVGFRQLQLSKRRAPQAGWKDARKRGKDVRKEGAGRRAVAGISSPASQLITQRLPKNIPDHRAEPRRTQAPRSQPGCVIKRTEFHAAVRVHDHI